MVIRKKILFCILTVIALNAILLLLWFGRQEKKEMMINVDGFEVVYNVTNRVLTIEDFREIELGSSLNEIVEKVGEPDTWIGCGMLWPVYFLEGNKAVALHFVYPEVCENLWIIELYDENGESQVIKEG
ncbi:MAG: hypothetical protein K2K96_10605 [Lachnospiraceae bacterium]|nr:hypothetical protein [Lachnospiraceae bacterium]